MSVAHTHARASAFSLIPRYVPFPIVVTKLALKPTEAAVLRAILSRTPFAWNRLLDGHRLTVNVGRDELSSLSGLGATAVRNALRGLEAQGLLCSTRRGRNVTSLEILPTSFGLPDDDLERRRLARKGLKRYLPYPLAQIGKLAPMPSAVLSALITAAGVDVLTRLLAGEEVWVTTTTRDVAESARISERTVRAAFVELLDAGLVERLSVPRVGIAVRLLPAVWGLAQPPQTLPPEPIQPPVATLQEATIMPANPAKSEDRAGQQPFHEHEEMGNRSGAADAARTLPLYAALLAIVLFRQPVTTSALRARLRRAALNLAIAGADPEVVSHEGWALFRERGALPTPEAITGRVLRFQAGCAACEPITPLQAPAASIPQALDTAPLASEATLPYTVDGLLAALLRAHLHAPEAEAMLIARGVTDDDRTAILALWKARREEHSSLERAAPEPDETLHSQAPLPSLHEGFAVLRAAGVYPLTRHLQDPA